MEPVITITGTAVPLDRSDVDTDQIIPSDWLKRVERTGFGKGLFSEWRDDPEFVLNLPQFGGASVLVAGTNFGTGSSREHAVWAIMDFGFKAVRLAVAFIGRPRQNIDLRAAVVNVIFTRHVPAGKGQKARQRIAEDRTAHMAHMHRPGRVGRDKLDIHPQPLP
jgi:hypothetical protein